MPTVTIKSGGGSLKPKTVLENVQKETAIGWLWIRFIADRCFRSTLSEKDSKQMFEAAAFAVRKAAYVWPEGQQEAFYSITIESEESYENGAATGMPVCSIIIERGVPDIEMKKT